MTLNELFRRSGEPTFTTPLGVLLEVIPETLKADAAFIDPPLNENDYGRQVLRDS
jgi:hypothetical protein